MAMAENRQPAMPADDLLLPFNTVRSGVTMNSASCMFPIRGTASRNDMNTPIKTQNSIEIATAEKAVTATIS